MKNFIEISQLPASYLSITYIASSKSVHFYLSSVLHCFFYRFPYFSWV